MKRIHSLFVGFVVAFAAGCSTSSSPMMSHRHAVAESDLGDFHHPISTTNAEAQRQFDRGLALVYAFNHDEAIHSFKQALQHDPNLAMAHWGIALALGPNYNVDVDAEREKQAYGEIHKAMDLSAGASEVERAYIAALAKRYSNGDKPDLKQLAKDYADAMGELS